MWDKKCGEEKVRERDVEKKSSLDLQYNATLRLEFSYCAMCEQNV